MNESYCAFQSYCAAVRDHADRVINKWRAIIDGNLPKESKPVSAAGGQKRPPTGGAGDARAVTTHAAKADGPPAKKTAPVKTAPSQFRDTGTLNAAYSLPHVTLHYSVTSFSYVMRVWFF